jgi:hypothetical protein
LSSVYTPTPRFTFFGFGSATKASVTPRIGSAGAMGTEASAEGREAEAGEWGAFIGLE